MIKINSLREQVGTYQKTGKELMSQDEITVMNGSKCIFELRGVRPFLWLLQFEYLKGIMLLTTLLIMLLITLMRGDINGCELFIGNSN